MRWNRYLVVPYLAVTASSLFAPPIEWLFPPPLPPRKSTSDNVNGEVRNESLGERGARMLRGELAATQERALSNDTVGEEERANERRYRW